MSDLSKMKGAVHMRPIIKTVAFISAIVMSISSYSGLINTNTVYAADDTEILSSQLSMPIISIDTLGNSVTTKTAIPMPEFLFTMKTEKQTQITPTFRYVCVVI